MNEILRRDSWLYGLILAHSESSGKQNNFCWKFLSVQDALPPKEMNPAEKHCKIADVVLCLGTR